MTPGSSRIQATVVTQQLGRTWIIISGWVLVSWFFLDVHVMNWNSWWCCWMSLLKSAWKAISLLESWTVASDSLDDIFPRRNTLLLALANGAEWPRALHVASEMVKDETSYNTLNFGCDAIAKNSVGQLASGQINGMPPRIDALARGGQWEASLCILQVMFEETFIKANLSPQNWPINAGWWTLISEGYQFWNIPNLSQSDTEIWFQRYVFRVCQWPVTSIDYVNPYCNAGEHQAQSHFLQFCDKCLCQRRSLVGGTGASGENEEGQMPQSEPRTKRPDANDRMHFVSDNETHGSNSTALTHFNPMCSSFWCANVDTLYDRFMFHHSTHQFWTTEIHWSIKSLCNKVPPQNSCHKGLSEHRVYTVPQKWIKMACST